MSTLIPIPKLGQSEETVKIEKWRVKEGDKIKKGDILFEVETDKAVLEVESQFEGTLLKIVIPAGKEVPVMATAAVIGNPGEAIPKIEAPKTIEKKAEVKKPAEVKAAPAKSAAVQTVSTAAAPVQQASCAPAAHGFKPKPSPRARKFAEDYLINLDAVPGSGGESGRVTEADVKKYLESSGYSKKLITPSAFNLAKKEKLSLLQIEGTGENGRVTIADIKAAASEKPREFSNMRKIIAKRLTESKQRIPHFYVTVSVDMTEVSKKRKALKDQGINMSVNLFIIKAVALALKEFPMLNAETDGLSVKYKSKVNIGVAVSLESGLVVPVVRNTDKKALDEIQAEVSELAEKARTGKLQPDEMKGGTFTISNMGMLNVENFSAIINPGETAILAVSSAMPTPVVKDGQVVVRDMMKITVSADHRAVDGSDAAKFANAVKLKLESVEFLNREL
ncbi:MAG: dihydrolipoamide acetyltransferase family protein [Victivallales bacterium]|jgi:pyruvate dehydrogenase E2 component (dihydrolipoamide acetyltransferase)